MNNPRRILFTNGNVAEYVYSADGEKLRTIHRTAVNNITVPIGNTLPLTVANTLSVDSTDYIGPFIFENNKPDKVLFSGGFCSFTDSNQPVFHYYTQDHLGNNRAVVNENGTLEQVTHYYPFGGVYGDTGLNASAQPYKYNGKELDRMHGLDWYDYGARDYDAALAQWTKMNPLCETYKGINPYAYCMNNPIKFVDIKGFAPGDFFISMDAAANDFGLTFNDNSIRGNVEYGSTIFIIHNRKGQIGYTYTIPNIGDYSHSTSSIAPWGVRAVANIHTHGECSYWNDDDHKYYDNEFSGARDDEYGTPLSNQQKRLEHSVWDIGQANKNKHPSYLATPNGSLQKYDPKTGKTVVVNNNMPSDVKDPTRKNKVSSSETKKYDLKDEIEWQKKIDQEAANERIIKF